MRAGTRKWNLNSTDCVDAINVILKLLEQSKFLEWVAEDLRKLLKHVRAPAVLQVVQVHMLAEHVVLGDFRLLHSHVNLLQYRNH